MLTPGGSTTAVPGLCPGKLKSISKLSLFPLLSEALSIQEGEGHLGLGGGGMMLSLTFCMNIMH